MSTINSLSLSAQHSIHQTSSSLPPPREKTRVMVQASDVEQTLKTAFDIAETLGLQPLQSEVGGPEYVRILSPENLYPITFNFPPDNPDGTYSTALQQKINRFKQQLQHELSKESISDFGPDMFT